MQNQIDLRHTDLLEVRLHRLEGGGLGAVGGRDLGGDENGAAVGDAAGDDRLHRGADLALVAVIERRVDASTSQFQPQLSRRGLAALVVGVAKGDRRHENTRSNLERRELDRRRRGNTGRRDGEPSKREQKRGEHCAGALFR